MPSREVASELQAFLSKYCIELANRQMLADLHELVDAIYTKGQIEAIQYCIMLIERAMV